MSKDEFLKIQTCVLKVNIHCDGCKHKVKKILQKIEGVYTTKIDSEQGKVTVSGNIDANTLIKKLIKNGKHAELWGAKPNNNNHNQLNQFKNLQISNGGKGDVRGGNNKGQGQKGGGNQQQKGGGGGGSGPQGQNPHLQQIKGFQDMKMLPQFMKDMKMPPNNGKDQNAKSVKFKLPEDEDLSDDDFDDDDDYDDDEFDDDYDLDDEMDHAPPNKMKPMMGGGHGGPQMPNMMMQNMMNGQHLKQNMMSDQHLKPGGNAGGANGKKGGGGGGGNNVPVQINHGGGGGSGKKGGNGNNGGGNPNQGGGGAKGGKNGGGGGGGGQNKNGGGGGGLANSNHFMPNGAKKMGDGPHGMPNMMSMNGGNNMGMSQMGHMGNLTMGQMSNLPAVQGLPASAMAGGGPGYGGGGGPGYGGAEHMQQGNPYYQQQLAAMMMNQQRANGNERFQPMMYARPPPAVNYMPPYPPYPYPPPPGERADQYAMFSDENTSSCSLM